jgi:hypothetical protein
VLDVAAVAVAATLAACQTTTEQREGTPNDAFAEGFIEGAAEVYDDVADQL